MSIPAGITRSLESATSHLTGRNINVCRLFTRKYLIIQEWGIAIFLHLCIILNY